MIKDEEEIRNIKKACEITDNCFSYILDYIKPGMTEKQIANEIEEYYKQRTDGLSCRTVKEYMPQGTGQSVALTTEHRDILTRQST